jgi:V/A-type H+-transporting ATPase subunit F
MTPYVVGEEEVVLGFALIGVPGSVASTRDDALRELSAANEKRGQILLLVTEAVADLIRNEIRSAVVSGIMVQVISGVRPARGPREDSQALLLSALGIKL